MLQLTLVMQTKLLTFNESRTLWWSRSLRQPLGWLAKVRNVLRKTKHDCNIHSLFSAMMRHAPVLNSSNACFVRQTTTIHVWSWDLRQHNTYIAANQPVSPSSELSRSDSVRNTSSECAFWNQSVHKRTQHIDAKCDPKRAISRVNNFTAISDRLSKLL